MINRLNLIWRLIGGNIILIIIGILMLQSARENAEYILTINAITAIIVILQIITRNLSVSSEVREIVRIYVVCSMVVNCFNIENTYQCLISSLCAIVNSIWITKFIMLDRLKEF